MWARGRGGHKIRRRESQCVSILQPLSMVWNMVVGVKCTITRMGLICWKHYRKWALQYVYEQWNLFTYTLIYPSKFMVQIYNVAVLAASHQLSALLICTHFGRRFRLCYERISCVSQSRVWPIYLSSALLNGQNPSIKYHLLCLVCRPIIIAPSSEGSTLTVIYQFNSVSNVNLFICNNIFLNKR